MKIKKSHNIRRKNAVNIRSLLTHCFLVTGVISPVALADTLWQENFDNNAIQNKGAVYDQVDMTGINHWSIDVSGAELTASSDWFKVNNGQLEARDVDGTAVWLSENIDIHSANDLVLALTASESGKMESTDYIDVSYSIDNQPFVLLTNWQGKGDGQHTLIDDFNTASINQPIGTGSNLQIKISMQNNAGSEYLRIDNIKVIANQSNGGDNNGDGSNSDNGNTDDNVDNNSTISGACFNCPDLTKISNAAEFDASKYYEGVIEAITSNEETSTTKHQLNNILVSSHNSLSYSQAWTALTKTDEDPQNSDNVILLYKGNSISKMSNGSGSQSNNPDNWNREHVWAKSHGFPSSSAFAYTDIHHLRPSDISVNAARGNLDFDYSDNALGEAPENRKDNNSFEPRDAVKGDVARILFYMDMRYDGTDGNTPDLELLNRITSTGQPNLGKICTLLAWHQLDPVDNFEQTRNNRIYEFQGNRNPFIDFPQWVEYFYATDCSGHDDSNGGDNGTDTGNGDSNGGDNGTDNGNGDSNGGDNGTDNGTGNGSDNGSGNTPSNSPLIISEYVEGSGFNKAVEIYNTSNQAVSLTGYQFKLYANGSVEPTSTENLTGSIAAHDVLVLVSSQVEQSSSLKPKADILSSAINFNGDDFIELTKGDIVVDSVGFYKIKQQWGKDVTLVRKPSVTQGDNNRNDSFDVTTQWLIESKDEFSLLGSHNANTLPDDGNNNIQLGQCGDSASFIYTLQGSGATSPLVGTKHIIEGIVTEVSPYLSGFFIEEEATDRDADVRTSDAIFVYQPSAITSPSVGDLVRLQGEVSEFYNRTQIEVAQDIKICSNNNVVPTTDLTMPLAANTHWENYEGMNLNFPQTLKVTNTYNLSRYGQIAISSERLIKPTNIYAANSSNAVALTERNARNSIVLDDGSTQQNPNNVVYPNGNLSFDNTVRLGDEVNNVSGIVDFSFGEYKLLPTQTPVFITTNSRTTFDETKHVDEIRIASFNLLNFFNGDGQGNGFPTQRGASNTIEFNRQKDKLVNALTSLNADIIGLMELENDGYDSNSAIAELVDALNNAYGTNRYSFVNPQLNKLGDDQIAVGLIFDSSRLTLVGNTVTTAQFPFNWGNRQPLVQSFGQIGTTETFTVAVNHFKSKGSCGNATNNNQDQLDGQGCWNELRTQAAQTLFNWLQSMPTTIQDSDILIIGDLNAYGKEDPINTLTSLGMKNLLADRLGINAYTYSFNGELGYLDHAIASPSLNSQVVSAKIWHINADEPRALDYNTEYKSANQINNYYSDEAYRASDHDPVVVTLKLNSTAQLVGDFDGDNDIDINDIRAFITLLRSGETLDIKYDFNGDNIVNTSDYRALMTLCTRNRCAVQ